MEDLKMLLPQILIVVLLWILQWLSLTRIPQRLAHPARQVHLMVEVQLHLLSLLITHATHNASRVLGPNASQPNTSNNESSSHESIVRSSPQSTNSA
ncbi:uncharacterized protein G2W53_000986 [Senna tora]|uniref:Uncharacterized protein n=1 Tax=Senna tora TaxID=362788 RepID=A0A835CJY5_9FABA|nr:uncharacterized protein G2W53_000986 [Senna tora]